VCVCQLGLVRAVCAKGGFRAVSAKGSFPLSILCGKEHLVCAKGSFPSTQVKFPLLHVPSSN
jgi:hypothetical protein